MNTKSTDAFRFPLIAYFVRDEFPFVRSCMEEALRRFRAEESPQQSQKRTLPTVRDRRRTVTCTHCGEQYLASHYAALKAQRGESIYCPKDRIAGYRTKESPYFTTPYQAEYVPYHQLLSVGLPQKSHELVLLDGGKV